MIKFVFMQKKYTMFMKCFTLDIASLSRFVFHICNNFFVDFLVFICYYCGHLQIYTHRVGKAVEFMITDALVEASMKFSCFETNFSHSAFNIYFIKHCFKASEKQNRIISFLASSFFKNLNLLFFQTLIFAMQTQLRTLVSI